MNIAEIKVEPGDSAPPASSTDGIPSAAEEVTNVLVPKKKRARRSPSSDEDLPPAPPPMQTIRLERQLDPEGSTLEWNILDDAREKGMVDVWGPVDEEVELVVDVGLEVDGSATLPAAGTVAGLLGLGGDDEDEVEIARRFEEKFEETKKIKVRRLDLCLFLPVVMAIDQAEKDRLRPRRPFHRRFGAPHRCAHPLWSTKERWFFCPQWSPRTSGRVSRPSRQR